MTNTRWGAKGAAVTAYVTRFGSLESYDKGTVEIVDDDPKHYAFSNVFEEIGRAHV